MRIRTEKGKGVASLYPFGTSGRNQTGESLAYVLQSHVKVDLHKTGQWLKMTTGWTYFKRQTPSPVRGIDAPTVCGNVVLLGLDKLSSE